jgi:hypothetical protein
MYSHFCKTPTPSPQSIAEVVPVAQVEEQRARGDDATATSPVLEVQQQDQPQLNQPTPPAPSPQTHIAPPQLEKLLVQPPTPSPLALPQQLQLLPQPKSQVVLLEYANTEGEHSRRFYPMQGKERMEEQRPASLATTPMPTTSPRTLQTSQHILQPQIQEEQQQQQHQLQSQTPPPQPPQPAQQEPEQNQDQQQQMSTTSNHDNTESNETSEDDNTESNETSDDDLNESDERNSQNESSNHEHSDHDDGGIQNIDNKLPDVMSGKKRKQHKPMTQSQVKQARLDESRDVEAGLELTSISLSNIIRGLNLVEPEDHNPDDVAIVEELVKTKYPEMFPKPLFQYDKMTSQYFHENLTRYDTDRLLMLFRVKNKPTFVRVEISILLLMEFFAHRSTSSSTNKQKQPLYRLWHSKIGQHKSMSYDEFLKNYYFLEYVLIGISTVSHPNIWLSLAGMETNVMHTVSKTVMPACTTTPEAIQSLEDDQDVTFPVTKLWASNCSTV